jgi:hypothetical protein
MMPPSPDPRFVLIAGDWHGNLPWALHVIDRADKLFTHIGEPSKIIIQLGDFGFRPTPANPDLLQMNDALAERGMELWWIDGNHEFHPDLRALQDFSSQFDDLRTRKITGIHLPGLLRIRYLPRGTRWTWAGKRWLAVGGAASVDRRMRTEGVNWWPEEELTTQEADAICASGSADVLLSHDCPDAWLPWERLGPPADSWIPELPRARAHSRRLERIARSVGVRRAFHGHYHIEHESFTEPGVHVTGLNMDGGSGNYILVDVERIFPSNTFSSHIPPAPPEAE